MVSTASGMIIKQAVATLGAVLLTAAGAFGLSGLPAQRRVVMEQALERENATVRHQAVVVVRAADL